MTTTSPIHRLLTTAAEHRGLLTPALAATVGVSDRTLRNWVGRLALPEVQPRVWMIPGTDLDWAGHLAAALLCVGPPGAATGIAALRLHGLETVVPPSPIQVVRPRGRRVNQLIAPVTGHTCSQLASSDISTVDGLAVVSAAWALAHLGRVASERLVTSLLIASLQSGMLTLAELDMVLDRIGRAPGVAALRRARRTLASVAPDSGLELDTHALLRRHGITTHPCPFPFRCLTGRVLHLDVVLAGYWIAFEVDTPETHGVDRFELDRRRWTLARRSGWDVRHISRQRLLDDPDGIIEEARETIAMADPCRQPPAPTRCQNPTCHACRTTFD